nr:hypothetical protein [Lysinibacillus timonensis]
MTEYNRRELSDILQVLAGILLIAGFAKTIAVLHGSVPGFALIGLAVGLAIIVGCWVGARHIFFMTSIVLMSIVFAIVSIFTSLFS